MRIEARFKQSRILPLDPIVRAAGIAFGIAGVGRQSGGDVIPLCRFEDFEAQSLGGNDLLQPSIGKLVVLGAAASAEPHFFCSPALAAPLFRSL